MKAGSDRNRTLRRRLTRFVKGHLLGDRAEREAARWFRDRGDETLRLQYPLAGGDVVLDCGGFQGDWAAAVHARYGCRVLVFEPVPAFCDAIRTRFAGNPRVQAFCWGLHSKDERASIALAGDASSCHRGAEAAQTIELRDVAQALPELGVHDVALLKINTEGGEYELLERLLDSGQMHGIAHLQVQFHAFVPDAQARRKRIRQRLRETHALSWNYEFIWESWCRR